MDSGSYVKLSPDDIATLAQEAIEGIRLHRKRRREELIQSCEDWKRKYENASWFRKIFMSKPVDHPRDREPDFLGLKEWDGVDRIASKWEELASTLAAERREVLVSANDLKALRGWAGRS